MTKQVPIGEFIIQKLNISRSQLTKLLNMQEYLDEKIGEISLREGFINQKELDKILEFQKDNGISFGSAAIHLGLIRNSQLKYLLDIQAQEKHRIGELLVQKKIVSQEDFLKILDEFYSTRKSTFTILSFMGETLNADIRKKLQPYHYHFHVHKSAEDPAIMLEKTKPQLVFLEAESEESLKLARKIKDLSAGSPLKIALFSEKKRKLEMLSGYENGVDYFLPLPFEFKNLINIVIDSEIHCVKKLKQSILIVDDSPIIRASVAEELGESGYRTLFAENGKEAVEIASLEKPDLITMDIAMPVMDGYQACLHLKNNPETAAIPIIILTANNTQEEREKGFEVGAVEYFTKPFTKGHLGNYIRHLLSPAGGMRPEKILVVDDSPVARNIFSSILNKNGFTFEMAESGEKVFELLKADHFEPSCILLDCLMPGMSGFQVCQKLKGDERYRKIPVIMITGAGDKENILMGLRAGADDYMVKPFDGDELIARIEAHLKNFSLYRKLQEQNELLRERENSLNKAKEDAEKANQLKDKFISLVSHDLRSPFTTIMGFLQLILEDDKHPLHQTHRELMETVMKKGGDLMEMIQGLLEVSRFKTGKVEPKLAFEDGYILSIEALAGVEPLARKKGVRLVNEVPAHTRFFVDLRLMVQVVQNLLTNAIKFSREGDTITLFVPPGEKSAIAVKDTGTGIEAKRLPKLFQYEEQTSTTGTAGEKGTGLGLPLSRDIMQAHGGSLEVESTQGQGSTFFVKLPHVRPRILVVDDSRIVRVKVIQTLQAVDADIVEAESGTQALPLLEAGGVHLVITDILMPEMDGFELIQMIRKKPKTKALPIIVITSDKNMETRSKVFQLGANDFVNKPFAVEDFIPRVRKFIQ